MTVTDGIQSKLTTNSFFENNELEGDRYEIEVYVNGGVVYYHDVSFNGVCTRGWNEQRPKSSGTFLGNLARMDCSHLINHRHIQTSDPSI